MTDFEMWWEEFPKGNGFTHRGVKFPRTRALRCNEAKCEKKFNKILIEKNLIVEEMLTALRREVHNRMENSIKNKRNELTYMSNSYAYLNGGFYEAWLDEEVEEEKIEKQNKLINPDDLF